MICSTPRSSPAHMQLRIEGCSECYTSSTICRSWAPLSPAMYPITCNSGRTLSLQVYCIQEACFMCYKLKIAYRSRWFTNLPIYFILTRTRQPGHIHLYPKPFQFANRYHLTNIPAFELVFFASARSFYDAFIYPPKISCPASWSLTRSPGFWSLPSMSKQFPGSIDGAKGI